MLASIALLLCLACTSCAGQHPNLSEYRNVSTHTVLRLGMDQAEVEQLLGTGTFFDWDAMLNEKNPGRNSQFMNEMRLQKGMAEYDYGEDEDYIFITYRHGTVLSLTVYPPDMETLLARSWWRNGFDLGYGASKEDLVAACGEPSDTIDTVQAGPYFLSILTYYYDASGALLERYEGASMSMEYCIEKESNAMISYSVTSLLEEETERGDSQVDSPG